MKYVFGFLFAGATYEQVLVISRNSGPNVGKLTGVGGVPGSGETPLQAINRIGDQEANIVLRSGDSPWQQFHYERQTETVDDFHFYTAHASQATAEDTQAVTSDPIVWADMRFIQEAGWFPIPGRFGALASAPVVDNLRYLLPMARHWLLYPAQRFTEQ